MRQAELDNVLDLLDLFAAENGGGREQACFQAAKAIRFLRTALAEARQEADEASEHDDMNAQEVERLRGELAALRRDTAAGAGRLANTLKP